MKKVCGKHLLMDIYGVGEGQLRDARLIKKFLNELPAFLGMSSLKSAALHKVISQDGETWGLTGFVVLYESHISCHTWPEHEYVAMDIYSCRDFDHHRAVKYLKEFWQYKRAITKVIKRDDFSVLKRTP
ncbi:MAG: adenosylmethionine decarboxylase [Patescibacteria group bacterium]|nr:adenosylmethionine decarboxylase [Patescibacteria group bacterium]